jgi:prepilin-type N-terminal cleavage/methylation domain-containing protein
MKRPRKDNRSRAFTLLEVILSMGILALLAASVYAIVSSSISASRTAMEQQASLRRLDSFLRVIREAFLNIPAQGTVSLKIAKSGGGQPEPQLILGKVQGLFGMTSLGGGTLVLASRPRSDGTRTITMLRIPPNSSDRELEAAFAAPGIPLLPKARKPVWSFQKDGDWKEEWPEGSPRPSLIRLRMEIEELPDPVEAVFWVPNVSAPQPTNAPGSTPIGGSGTNAPAPTPPSKR